MDDLKDTLLFLDITTPKPYHPGQLQGCGGTEATVIDVAEGLAGLGLFNVVVEEHNRFDGDDFKGKALYTSIGKTRHAKWVVVLRDPRPMVKARERFPNSKIYLWSHDLAERNLGVMYSDGVFKKSGCLTNICVSSWHKGQTIDCLKSFGYTGEFRIRYIYNPLSSDAQVTTKEYDKNKLVWLASPHKGIARAYDIFKYLIKLNPDFRLYVTNPGYMEDSYAKDEEVKDRTCVLGTLPHREALAHLRNSLCLFYPNTIFPETFGKIMAEANAVGTPVITSPIGASREVLDSHPSQIVDCRNTESVIKTVMAWYNGERPIVRGNKRFTLSNVIQGWLRELNDIR